MAGMANHFLSFRCAKCGGAQVQTRGYNEPILEDGVAYVQMAN